MEVDGSREKKTRLRGDIFHLCVLSVSTFRRAELYRNTEKSRRSSLLTEAYIIYIYGMDAFQFSSVAPSCLTLWDPMDCSMPGFPVHHPLPELLKLMSIKLVMPSSHLILCHPLLLLPSVFPSIRVFSTESVLCISWPKYWNFSFSIQWIFRTDFL